MKLFKQWNDRYLQKLGILDHCNELIQLNNEIIKAKANKDNIDNISDQLEKEMADLYIILYHRFNDSIIVDERIDRFIENGCEVDES